MQLTIEFFRFCKQLLILIGLVIINSEGGRVGVVKTCKNKLSGCIYLKNIFGQGGIGIYSTYLYIIINT